MGGYMSWQQAEANSPYASGVDSQQSASEAEARAGAAVGFRGSYGGEEGQAAQDFQRLQEDRARRDQANSSPSGNPYRVGSQAWYGYEIAYRDAQARSNTTATTQPKPAPRDYFVRSDIFAVSDPAQRSLMGKGLTAGQAAEQLRFESAQRGDYAGERKYETLRLQAWTTATGESAAYHTAARDSGLPQAPNPYEYAADLFTYAEKGYPQKRSEAFSPVDPRVLNLPGGQGGQAYIWKPDSGRNYDLRPAMDVVAKAQREGQMGAYGQLGTPTSSRYGTLSLADQQGIGRYVNENPANQRNGYITNEAAMSQFTPEVRAKNQGAFVSSLFPTAATAKKGGYLTNDELFAGAAEQSVFRPSDASLAARNLYGGQKDANPVNAAMITMWDFLTPGSNTVTKTGKTQEVDRARLDPSGGAMWTAKFINPATNKPTDVMKFKEGNPYQVGDMMYQDYITSDLSKVTVTPTMVTTSPTESGYDRGTRRAGEWTKSKTPELKLPVTNTVVDYPLRFGENVYAGVREKPIETAMNFGIGLGLTALTMGVINPAVTGVGSPILTTAVTRVLPLGLMGLYGRDYIRSSTLDYTDLSPKAAGRAGYRAGYETFPMLAGSVFAIEAPGMLRAARTIPGRVSESYYDAQLSRYNTARMPSGTSRGSFIDVQGTPVYDAPRSRSPYFDNERGSLGSDGWGRQATKVKTGTKEPFYLRDYAPSMRQTHTHVNGRLKKVIDVRDSYNVESGKITKIRPDYMATLAEQKMIMTQYRLSPQEIMFAQRTGASLNDILALRQPEVVVMQSPLSQSRSMIGSNLVQKMYPSQTSAYDTMALSRQGSMLAPSTKNMSLFGSQALIGSNLAQRLAVGSRSTYAVDTKSVQRAMTDSRVIPTTITGQRGGTRVTGLATSSLTTPFTDSITRSGGGRFPVVTTIPGWGRNPPTSQTWWNYGGGGGGGTKGTGIIPPIIPLGWGGGGSLDSSLRLGRGRKHTQIFSINFGKVTGSLFGGSPVRTRTARRPSTAKRTAKKRRK